MSYPWGPAPYGSSEPPPAPGMSEVDFWQRLRRGPGNTSLASMSGAPSFPDIGGIISDVGAAWTVLGGGEDPQMKPLAGKPKPAKVNPVPANGPNGGLQKSGPVDPAPNDLAAATAFPSNIFPEQPPSSAPQSAPGMVKVTLPDGRTFDYAAGESIPTADQGNFGPLTQPEGYTTGAGFVRTGEREIGGTGSPGGFAQATTPESELTALQHQGAMTRARAGISDPFPEITAKTKAEIEPRIAQARAADEFEQRRLQGQYASEQDSQRLIDEFEAQARQADDYTRKLMEQAQASGDEVAIQRAQSLRDRYETEAANGRRELELRLQAKGVRGTYKAQ